MSKTTVLSTTPDETAVDLAATLGIDPLEIWQYKQQKDAYVVLTRDYRKYSGVVRMIKKELPTAVETQDIASRKGRQEFAPPAGKEPQYLPPHLQPVYDEPGKATKAELVLLAVELEIPRAKSLIKAQLLTAVEEWKELHAP